MPAYTVTVQRKGETFRAILIHHDNEPDKAAAYAKWVWWDASKIWLQPAGGVAHAAKRRNPA